MPTPVEAVAALADRGRFSEVKVPDSIKSYSLEPTNHGVGGKAAIAVETGGAVPCYGIDLIEGWHPASYLVVPTFAEIKIASRPRPQAPRHI